MQLADVSLEDGLKMLAWIGSVAAGAFAFYKWLREVKQARVLREQELVWKQKAALMERIAAFGSTPGVHNAALMLSSPKRDVPLWDKANPADRYVTVTWEEVAEAMVPEDVALTSTQSAIRDSFGDFMSRLMHIELYRSSSLINDADVRAFVGLWSNRLMSDEPHAVNIRLYMTYRNLASVIHLFREVGGLDVHGMAYYDWQKYQQWKLRRQTAALPPAPPKEARAVFFRLLRRLIRRTTLEDAT